MSHPSKKIKTDNGFAVVNSEPELRNKNRKVSKPSTAKVLLDLNDDCLFEIFERSNIMDLAIVAQSCEHLEKIAVNIFKRKYKIVKLDLHPDEATEVEALRLFQIFGSLIVRLDIHFRGWYYDDDFSYSVNILNAVVEHCTSLKSLRLDSFEIADNEFQLSRMAKLFERLEKLHLEHVFMEGEWDTFDTSTSQNGNAINLFDNCTSLIELRLSQCDEFYEAIFQTLFPRLEHFIIEDSEGFEASSMNEFVMCHPNLKTFSLDCEHSHLPVAAANLAKLETFGFQFKRNYRHYTGTPVEDLAKFRNLKELICFFVGPEQNMSKLMAILPKLTDSLEVLDLRYGHGNRDFAKSINKMKKLKTLRLHEIDINGIHFEELKHLFRATLIIE